MFCGPGPLGESPPTAPAEHGGGTGVDDAAVMGGGATDGLIVGTGVDHVAVTGGLAVGTRVGVRDAVAAGNGLEVGNGV